MRGSDPAGVERSADVPNRIGTQAETLDRQRTTRERLRLPRATVRRLGVLVGVYVVAIGGLVVLARRRGAPVALAPLVVGVSFLLESADSAAGMGFGTGLAPLLFVLGYEPLEVVPPLLLSEATTGLVAGAVHQEVRNVTFSLRPINEETRLLALVSATGVVALVASAVGAYFAVTLPEGTVEAYAAIVVVLMGIVGLVRVRIRPRIEYRPRRLAAFAVLAGVNKGIGGGGYGPVVTIGQVLSGVYEKSAVAITSLAEGLVSLVGGLTFLGLWLLGTPVDLGLLPSIFTGGFFAAIVAPYLVRVVPNAVWRYAIPAYAVAIGTVGIVSGL